MKMQTKSNGVSQILVRCEPHVSCKLQPHLYLTILAPTQYELGYITGTIHRRLFQDNENGKYHSIYLFLKQKIVTQFKEKLGTYWAQHKEEDGILFLEYSDEAPF